MRVCGNSSAVRGRLPAAVREDGLYRSTDGGKTWKKLDGTRTADRHDRPHRACGCAEQRQSRVRADRIETKAFSGAPTMAAIDLDDGLEEHARRSAPVLLHAHRRRSKESRSSCTGSRRRFRNRPTAARRSKRLPTACTSTITRFGSRRMTRHRIITGEDGGYALTLDGGDNWFFSANLPIAQVYRVGLSTENPYWVCGGLARQQRLVRAEQHARSVGHSKQGRGSASPAATANGPCPIRSIPITSGPTRRTARSRSSTK